MTSPLEFSTENDGLKKTLASPPLSPRLDPPTLAENWDNETEYYLRQLSKVCGDLSERYKIAYNHLLSQERYFKIPIIILSSITGLISMLNTSVENTLPINITASIMSLIIATTNSTEAYLRVGQSMSGAILSSRDYQQLKEHIDCEISLHPKKRTHDGILFLKEAYQKYISISEMAPPILKHQRFVLPTLSIVIDGRESNSASSQS